MASKEGSGCAEEPVLAGREALRRAESRVQRVPEDLRGAYGAVQEGPGLLLALEASWSALSSSGGGCLLPLKVVERGLRRPFPPLGFESWNSMLGVGRLRGLRRSLRQASPQ